MKKLICLLMLAAIILSVAAVCVGESAGSYDSDIWEIFIPDEKALDYDNDETYEKASVSFSLNEWDDGDFTLTVGESSLTIKDCICLEPKLYAMKAGYSWYYYGTVFMVNEYGPSDDPLTYCILYTEGKLIDLGYIPAIIETFEISKSGVITTSVRARMIGTWSRPADYIIATGSEFDENDEWSLNYHICEAPRAVYPMGMIVTLKTDVWLSPSPYAFEEGTKLTKGEKVILAASDDARYLFVTDYKGENRGWLNMKSEDWMDYIMVSGRYLPVDDVFDNVFYAD